jgi:dienelactone hydrolase
MSCWRAVLGFLTLAAACASPTSSTPTPLSGFVLSGDAATATGATWRYESRDAGVDYDLQGVLLKPAGSGPFPAVIISHGNGGSAMGYGRTLARTMVEWGLVCIATNYTHAGGVTVGSPGTASEPGASTPNVQRARKLVDILGGLAYVDSRRLALHGHSMGAFVTAAAAGAHPSLFRVASHTAGGITPNIASGFAAPTESQIAGIRTPYQMHHGDRDFVVLLALDQLFAAALQARGVTHDLVVYPGADHDDLSNNPLVLARIREWYQRHELF